MSERVLFTGERLHAGSDLFAVDLARHRAAYQLAARVAREGPGAAGLGGAAAPERPARRVLDLGCGSGYGVAELAAAAPGVVGVDRIAPDAEPRRAPVRYLRADLNGIPLAPGAFDLVVSFQVIEHLPEPTRYLEAIARLLAPGGAALLTTPNRLTSDGENPYHVREYTAAELGGVLRRHFADVRVHGIGAGPAVAAYYQARLDRIRRIIRLDPLGLRRRIPHRLATWIFARLAVVIRRGIAADAGLPDATPEDFPLGPAADDCLDLLAVCRRSLTEETPA